MVLTATALFLGLVFFILGSSLTTRLETYHVLFDENVKGMVVGSKVNFQGVPIGAVADIRFRDGRTEVEMLVDPTKATIQTVTRARIDRLLVTGQVTVELEGHEPGAPRLHEGAVVLPIVSPMNQLMTNTLPHTLDKVDELLTRGVRVLTEVEAMLGPRNRENLATLLEGVAKVAAGLDHDLERVLGRTEARLDDLGALLGDARRATAAFEQAGERITAIAGSDDVAGTLAALRRAVERLSGLQDELQGLTGEAKGLLASSRSPLLETLGGARQTLAELQALARGLRLAPSSLLFGRQHDGAAMPATPLSGGGR